MLSEPTSSNASCKNEFRGRARRRTTGRHRIGLEGNPLVIQPFRRSRATRYWLALIIYICLLCVSGVWQVWPLLPETSLWELQHTSQLATWAYRVAVAATWQIALFLPMGVLVSYSLGRRERPTFVENGTTELTAGVRSESQESCSIEQARTRWSVNVEAQSRLVTLVGIVLARILLCVVAAGFVIFAVSEHPPFFIAAICFAVTGAAAGVWIGSMWRLGRRGRLWLAAQIGMLFAGLVAGGLWLNSVLFEESPLPFEPIAVTSAEKRRVVELLNQSRSDATKQHFRLHLKARDVNFLLAWGLSIGSENRKGKVTFGPGQSEGMASVGFPIGERSRFLNVRAVGQLAVESGAVEFEVKKLEVGRLELPPRMVHVVLGLALFVLQQDEDIGVIIDSLELVRLDSTGIEVVVSRREIDGINGRVIRSLLARLGSKPDFIPAVRVQVNHLVSRIAEMPEGGDERLLAFLHAAFRLARDRSQDRDPVRENSAAILALGILLGHRKVERLVGTVTTSDLRAKVQENIGQVTLRGRGDWSRHFWVSAALATLSADLVSDAAGLLKEELDAGEGGSGFSFADLLADRAGTEFSNEATRDEASARRIQELLCGEVRIGELFPQASDLPEGIPETQMQSDYGGVGGQRYQEVIQEIERRLAGCRLLR